MKALIMTTIIMVLTGLAHASEKNQCLNMYKESYEDAGGEKVTRSALLIPLATIHPAGWGLSSDESSRSSANTNARLELGAVLELYSQARIRKGPRYERLINRIGAMENKELVSSIIYELFKYDVMCDQDLCNDMKQDSNSSWRATRTLYRCDYDSFVHIISEEYFDRLSFTQLEEE